MVLYRDQVKKKAQSLGCDLCGIAGIGRFEDIPAASNPLAILPEAESVIVIALKFLSSTVKSTSTIPYTILRNQLSRRIDEITIKLSYYLEASGQAAVPTGAIEPCNYNHAIDKTTGLISLKNAAYQAGLGVIGKNTLLITPEYGNMVWLGAVITGAKLEADPVIAKNPCRENCTACLSACRAGALDGSRFMDQNKCWNHAFGEPEEGGEWRIKCFACRSQCPYTNGYTL